jgi:hypothetical protein
MTSMRVLLTLTIALTISSAAQAVPLPTGSRWFFYAPRADQFAREAETLLTSTSQLAATLSPRRMNSDLTRSLGLGLVQTETVNASGIDVSKPWMLFERNGISYLAVSVKSRETLTATLEAWAEARLLKARDEKPFGKAKGVMVTFARAAGSKPAGGYIIAGDRAVILAQKIDRAAELQAAYEAIDSAPSVQPGVEGTLLVWLGRESAIRDGWLGIKALEDGVDVTGAANKIDAGFVSADTPRAEWIRALTAAPAGGGGEIPAWARVIAGPKSAAQLVTALGPVLSSYLSEAAGKAWLENLRTLATGPVEMLATDVDVRAVESAEGGGTRQDLLRLLKPTIVFPNASDAAVSSTLKQSSAALCQAKTIGEEAVRAMCVEPSLTVGRQGKSLFVGWTGALTKPAPPPALAGAPIFNCAKGVPIAAVRLSPSTVANALKDVGILSAMSSQSLAGLLAVGSEYGRLLKASQPAIGLACQEPSGRVTLQGRWRFVRK